MQIELIGVTGAGKSSLLDGMLHACHEQGMQAITGDDYVLERAHLSWVRGYLARTLLVDLVSLSACLRIWRKRSGFFRLVLDVMSGLKEVGRFEKLNIIRNTFKKVGIYEIVRRGDSDQRFVFLDEGTLHTAHYLFVHLTSEYSDNDLSRFMESVPLPDVAIYLRQEEDVLIARTLARGHKRIRGGSRSMTERFIQRAMRVFDELTSNTLISSRMLVVDAARKIQIPQNGLDSLAQKKTLEVLRAGLFLVKAGEPAQPTEASLTL